MTQSVCAGLVNRVTYSLSEMPSTASSRLLSVRFDCPGGVRASFQNCPSAFFKPRRMASSFIASVFAFSAPASSASAAGESARRRFSASAQYKAFVDSWRWGPAADYAFSLVMASGSQAAGIMSSFQNYMQKSDLMAYLTMMAARLLELHRILSPAGSLYLHCDSTASHYLKIVLDSIFGPAAFRNEIVWKRSHAHNDGKQGAKHFGRITDSLLFYTKSQSYTWNRLFRPYDKKYIDRDYRRIDEDRRRYRIDNMRGPGGAEKGNPFYEVMGVSRYWAYSKENMEQFIREGRVIQTRPGAVPQLKRYLDEMPGMPIQNLWDDLPVLNNRSREVLGYPTQKPLALLERIISASSNPGDVVLDPFCGCGTAIEAAQALNRKWIGIDITALALDVVERRLLRTFRTLRREADYFVEGIPPRP